MRTKGILLGYLVVGLCVPFVGAFGQALDAAAYLAHGDIVRPVVLSAEAERLMTDLRIPDPRSMARSDKGSLDKLREVTDRFQSRAKEILNRSHLPNNIEFQAYFFYLYGISFFNRLVFDSARVYLEKSFACTKGHEDQLLTLRACLHGPLTVVYTKLREPALAYPYVSEAIEKCQGIGTGDFTNYHSASMIKVYPRIAAAVGISDEQIRRYLLDLSTNYSNEIACSADATLLTIAMVARDAPEVERIRARLETRYPKSWKYTNLYESLLAQYDMGHK